jgi:hypothetical protein
MTPKRLSLSSLIISATFPRKRLAGMPAYLIIWGDSAPHLCVSGAISLQLHASLDDADLMFDVAQIRDLLWFLARSSSVNFR